MTLCSRVLVRRTKGKVVSVFPHHPPALCLSPAGAPAGVLRIKGWKLAEGLPLSLGRSSQGSLLSWSGDQWIWTGLPRLGAAVTGSTCGICLHGSSKLPTAGSPRWEKKAKWEHQKEKALPEQRRGSQQAKIHVARRDELLVRADFKSACNSTLQPSFPAAGSERDRNNLGHK